MTMINHPNRKKIENTLFPGRYNYTGPTKGWFGFLHHEQLCEKSHDVNERIAYVKHKKPKNEVAIRLHNMIYLGGCEAMAKHALLDADYEAKRALLYADYEAKHAPLDADYEAKLAPLDADYKAKRAPLDADYEAKRAPLYADYEAKRAPLDAQIIAYIRVHIPDCVWDGKTLVFP